MHVSCAKCLRTWATLSVRTGEKGGKFDIDKTKIKVNRAKTFIEERCEN